MKRNCVLWVVSCMVLLLNRSQAQTVDQPYQLQIHQGQNLQEAIDRLASDYQIDFAYAPDMLSQEPLEAAYFSAGNIESLLRQLLQEAPIQYRILSEDRILLRTIDLEEETTSWPYQAISGRIMDAFNGEAMMNVAIAVDTLNLGTLSDGQGLFNFSLPPGLGQRSIYIYHIGYKTKKIPLDQLESSQTIRLEPVPLSLNEVLIVDQLPRLSSSLSDGSIRMNKQALGGAAASQLAGEDVFRQVQLLAGVGADDDLSSDIRIRGSNADETLIILDGMPLHKVDHFYGVFSALNSSFLEEARLYKNALPVQYGGRTGGMLLLQSANEIKDFSGELDFNLLSAALKLNLPISPKIGLSLSGRRSHLNVASSKFFDWVGEGVQNYTDNQVRSNRPDVIETNPDFQFSDWNAKLLFIPNKNHRLAFNFYNSDDDYLNSYYDSFQIPFRQQRLLQEETFSDQQDWQNLSSSIQYQGELGNNWKMMTDIFYGRYRFSGSLMAKLTRIRPRLEPLPQLDTLNYQLGNSRFNRVDNAGYRMLFEKGYGAGHVLQFGSGLNFNHTDFSLGSEEEILLTGRDSSFDAQIFSRYQWYLLDRLQVAVGGRLNYYKQTSSFYFAPRVTANYRFDGGLGLKGSYSINYQFIRELTYENRLGQSIDLILLSNGDRFPTGKSINYMLGATYSKGPWLFDLEFYHKQQENVLDFASNSLGFGSEAVRPARRQNYRLFKGEGTVNGMDITIAWEYPHYNGHMAYTLSKATNSFPQILDGTAVLARDDRRHQLKWINTWTLGRFDLSANLIYSSGKPYYDLALIPKEEGDRGQLNLKRYVSWLPSYQRMDLGLAYRFKIGSTNATLGASVFNLTNHDNVKYLQYIYSANTTNNGLVNSILGTQTDLLDRTLNLSFGLRF